MIRGYTMYVRFGAWGGWFWFGAFACSLIDFAFGFRNPCMRAPSGCSEKGWFGVGLALFVIGFALAS